MSGNLPVFSVASRKLPIGLILLNADSSSARFKTPANPEYCLIIPWNEQHAFLYCASKIIEVYFAENYCHLPFRVGSLHVSLNRNKRDVSSFEGTLACMIVKDID